MRECAGNSDGVCNLIWQWQWQWGRGDLVLQLCLDIVVFVRSAYLFFSFLFCIYIYTCRYIYFLQPSPRAQYLPPTHPSIQPHHHLPGSFSHHNPPSSPPRHYPLPSSPSSSWHPTEYSGAVTGPHPPLATFGYLQLYLQASLPRKRLHDTHCLPPSFPVFYSQLCNIIPHLFFASIYIYSLSNQPTMAAFAYAPPLLPTSSHHQPNY